MTNINATSLRKDLFNLLDNAIKYNETINVSTKSGNAIILSEEEYNGLIATIELCSDERLKEKLVEGAKTSNEECMNIEEAKW